MKFEYDLAYNFVSNELSFKITEMPEDFRDVGKITEITSSENNRWEIKSSSHPEIMGEHKIIYLRGICEGKDDLTHKLLVSKHRAREIAEVLEKFQKWVEDSRTETVVTIAEIEEKLGIKNLKIVKEVK